MTTVFHDRYDIAIRFVTTLMVFAEVFHSMSKIQYYRENIVLFERVSVRIRCMPKVYIIEAAWYIVNFLMTISMFYFYIHSDNVLNIAYVLDVVTIVFLFQMILNKTWLFVFFKLRQTILSCIMIFLVILCATTIILVFGVNKKWLEMSLYLPYLIWNFFFLYLNFAWCIEERHLVPIPSNTSKTNLQPFI